MRNNCVLPQNYRFLSKQEDIHIKNHAIGCRINAGNPRTFIPSPGKMNEFYAPGGFRGTRGSSFIQRVIKSHYDSTIGRIVTWGEDRDTAIVRMQVALSETVIEGIETDISLHQKLFNDEPYAQAAWIFIILNTN